MEKIFSSQCLSKSLKRIAHSLHPRCSNHSCRQLIYCTRRPHHCCPRQMLNGTLLTGLKIGFVSGGEEILHSLQDHNSGVTLERLLFNRDIMSKTPELTARIALTVKQVTKKQQRNKEELIILIKGREQNKTA